MITDTIILNPGAMELFFLEETSLFEDIILRILFTLFFRDIEPLCQLGPKYMEHKSEKWFQAGRLHFLDPGAALLRAGSFVLCQSSFTRNSKLQLRFGVAPGQLHPHHKSADHTLFFLLC